MTKKEAACATARTVDAGELTAALRRDLLYFGDANSRNAQSFWSEDKLRLLRLLPRRCVRS